MNRPIVSTALRALMAIGKVVAVSGLLAINPPARATDAPIDTPVAAALRRLVSDDDPEVAGNASLADRQRLAALYESVGFHPLWSTGAKLSPAARQLLAQLATAGARGLDPQDYRGDALSALAAESASAGAERWLIFDVELSLAALKFISDLHLGRVDPTSVGHNLTLDRLELDRSATVAQLAQSTDVAAALDALEPQFTHYALLKRALAQYRKLAAEPELPALPSLPPKVKSIKPGEAYAGAAQLQQLLTRLGDLPAAPSDTPPAPSGEAPPATLTPALVAALRHFQRRHGEEPDGVLGAATLAELNVPLTFRVRQIELTLERWRWMPAKLDTAPIIVNIPEFRLFAFESTADSEASIQQMDVIVGKAFEATQTPVFAADMKYLIFRPYWEVPYSIALKELVPEARRNPAAIEKHHMDMVRGGADDGVVEPNTAANVELVAQGVLRLRQRPGPDNSLGLVKFMFPNPYNVYLHSTPARALFEESRRDFSHGCVRVSDPVGLAEYVLRDSPGWTRDRIEAAMNGTVPQTVTLAHHIRVFIVYGTALAKEDGTTMFFNDIYGHDARLEAALNSRRPRAAIMAPVPDAATR